MSACGGGGGTSQQQASGTGANAGADRTVLLGAVVNLDGSGSVSVNDAQWTFTGLPEGSTATISNSTTLTASFTPDKVGTYLVRLSINGNASADTTSITVNNALANISVPAGSSITTRTRLGVTEKAVDLGATGATLSAAASTTTGTPTYLWEQIAGPAATLDPATTTSAVLSFTAPTVAGLLNRADVVKWQVLPISRLDTRMVFRLTIDGTDTETMEVWLQDGGKEIHPSSGLNVVGVGTKVYLAGAQQKAFGTSIVLYTGWSWNLTVPEGSNTTFTGGSLTSTSQFPSFTPDVPGQYVVTYCTDASLCPLGTGTTRTPVILTSGYNAPVVITPGTLSITAADYVGVGAIGDETPTGLQCANCHGENDATIGTRGRDRAYGNMVHEWQSTKHSHIFSDNYATYSGLLPSPYLWQQHTTGYNTDANNEGFDDLARDFTLPTTAALFPATYADFTSSDPEVAKLANVQCESCHGPGSQHHVGGLYTGIAKSASESGVCGQCHIEEEQWKQSKHNSASTSSYGTWLYTDKCTKCHTTEGFIKFMEAGGVDHLDDAVGALDPLAPATVGANRAYLSWSPADPILYPKAFGAVNCIACHDPHFGTDVDGTNPYQLRIAGEVTLMKPVNTTAALNDSDNSADKVNAGTGAICYECHFGNRELNQIDCINSTTNTAVSPSTWTQGTGRIGVKCDTWQKTVTNYPGDAVHDVAQAGVLEGKLAFTNLKDTGDDDFSVDGVNSFHSSENFTLGFVTGDRTLPAHDQQNNKCVTCHMAAGPALGEVGYGKLGSHAFHMTPTTDTPVGDTQNIKACQACHGDLTDYNRNAGVDYDGDGSVEGIQDEIKGLMVNLTKLIKANAQSKVGDYLDTWTGTTACTTNADCATGGTDGATYGGVCSTATSKCTKVWVRNGSYVIGTGATATISNNSITWIGTSAGMPLGCGVVTTAITTGTPTSAVGDPNCSSLNTYVTQGSGSNKKYPTSKDDGLDCSTLGNVSGSSTALPDSAALFTTHTATKSTSGYRNCTFLATDNIIKRAIWNHDIFKVDDSYGIHNAGYTIRVLQATYAALVRDLDAETNGSAKNVSGTTVTHANAPTFSYQTDFPAATLR
ncbi:MAG: hypothetical protein HQM15_11315 [Deltaproteobacteria bacterium]|nr:hypothetical protein [Deltaproteobacteria bacterium]